MFSYIPKQLHARKPARFQAPIRYPKNRERKAKAQPARLSFFAGCWLLAAGRWLLASVPHSGTNEGNTRKVLPSNTSRINQLRKASRGGGGYPGRPGGRRTGSPMRCLPPQGSQSAATGIQRDAMIFFDEDDLNCWIVLALLSILMALPLH